MSKLILMLSLLCLGPWMFLACSRDSAPEEVSVVESADDAAMGRDLEAEFEGDEPLGEEAAPVEAKPAEVEKAAAKAADAPKEPEMKEADVPRPPLVADEPQRALLNPALAHETAPDQFQVRFETTRGDFTVEVRREWAPKGADRFFNLVKIGYFDDVAFFRVIEGFVAQFGLSGNPQINAAWREARIADDPVRLSNERGTLVFATSGPDSRTTQLFINLVDNPRLDDMGFSPFARVAEGIGVVDSLYSGYGEGAPRGRGPSQGEIHSRGNDYLKSQFPSLDFVKTAQVIQ